MINESEVVLERLRTLEQHVRRMDKALHDQSADQSNGDNNDSDVPLDTEIFGIDLDHTALASLSCHINALKRTLLPNAHRMQPARTLPHVPFHSVGEMETSRYLRNLPSVPQIKSLISLYFEHLNNFFPCLNDAEFRKRLSQIEGDQVLEGDQICLLVKASSRTFLMLMCMVLATATYLDPSSHQGKGEAATPGWRYFLMGEKISGRGECLRNTGMDLDLVRYHTVKAIYMIHVEKLTAASHAIGTSIQLAFSIGLNDESTWDNCSESDKRARRSLWWTIFYMDRRIAQKCWKPYLIREVEVQVKDMESTETSTFNAIFDMETYSDLERQRLTNRYLQTEISWARLWALIWDSMFAARAQKGATSTEEIEILDARILHAQRQTHESLHWETIHLPNHIAEGETEAQIRSRLVAYVVCQSCLRIAVPPECSDIPSNFDHRESTFFDY